LYKTPLWPCLKQTRDAEIPSACSITSPPHSSSFLRSPSRCPTRRPSSAQLTTLVDPSLAPRQRTNFFSTPIGASSARDQICPSSSRHSHALSPASCASSSGIAVKQARARHSTLHAEVRHLWIYTSASFATGPHTSFICIRRKTAHDHSTRKRPRSTSFPDSPACPTAQEG
jgi:hypothetical protein